MNTVNENSKDLIKLAMRDFERKQNEGHVTPILTFHLGSEKMLALYLHRSLCHYDHNDYCGFYYHDMSDENDWNTTDLNKWLVKAQKMLEIVPFIKAREIAAIL